MMRLSRKVRRTSFVLWSFVVFLHVCLFEHRPFSVLTSKKKQKRKIQTHDGRHTERQRGKKRATVTVEILQRREKKVNVVSYIKEQKKEFSLYQAD
mmetsp:Transcript_25486/g.49833  ORF Transcript_25486/g.49833 Transcript_25486/m.49833 type:complete len:96 (-) Transcript_25486:993-1280(-)